MFITVAQLQEFTGVYAESTGTLQTIYCGAACDIINNYLGYNAEEEFTTIPAVMSLTALRIAAILQTEEKNNIGITSKSFGESGTRTFINTVNFDKYLSVLSCWRKVEEDES